jgi:hypothetical protein
VFDRSKKTAFGDTKARSMEHNCVVGVSLFAAAGLLMGGTFNAALGMSAVMVAGTFLLGLLFLIFYYLSRFENMFAPLFWPMIFTGCLMLTFLWVYNAGIRGPAMVWAPIAIGVAVVIGNGCQRYAAVALIVANLITLLVVQYQHPDLIIGYATPKAWFVDAAVTLIISAVVITLLARFLHNEYRLQRTHAKDSRARLSASSQALDTAAAEIENLSGLLPVCPVCRNVRTDKDYWRRINDYIDKHPDAAASHSVCPDCAGKQSPAA